MSKSKKSDEVRGTWEKASYLSLIVTISNMMGREGGGGLWSDFTQHYMQTRSHWLDNKPDTVDGTVLN